MQVLVLMAQTSDEIVKIVPEASHMKSHLGVV